MAPQTLTAPAPAPDVSRMPGHWLLAKLGKRVLRPGGVEMTRWMLETLALTPTDRVLELAPGLGATARAILAARPMSYVGVDRDEDAVATIRGILAGTPHSVVLGQAQDTGLPAGSRDVVLGEAMLTMNPPAIKAKIVEEAFRVLAPGGRYAIHELSLVPDDLDGDAQSRIHMDLSRAIHVGAKPLTVGQWRAVLEEAGFVIESMHQSPMHLLEAGRFLQDEGLGRTIRFLWNLLREPGALARVREMRGVFRQHQAHMGAIAIVARKP